MKITLLVASIVSLVVASTALIEHDPAHATLFVSFATLFRVCYGQQK